LHSRRYRYVLLDLDGTLVDSAESIIASVRHALGHVHAGREQPDRDTILMQIGKPLQRILAELGYPADPESARRFADTYRPHYAQHVEDGAKLYPDTIETLAALRGPLRRLRGPPRPPSARSGNRAAAARLWVGVHRFACGTLSQQRSIRSLMHAGF